MNSKTPFTLEGKIILVTGASSGIGRSVAIECSKMGANVIVTARDKTRLEETLAQCQGGNGDAICADLTKVQERTALVTSIPSIDGIVHCAGKTDPLLFQYMAEERLREIYELNFFSPILLTQALLKEKKIQKKASIVFISSIAGTLCASIGGSMYASTKSAINGMVKGLALDLAMTKTRVNTICPGMIDTNIFDNSSISKEQLAEDIKKYPLKRYGKPEEVAYTAIYLLSDASQWVTGSNLVIDGGFTLL